MDVTVVAHAILRGVKAATSSTSLNFLREIHLVLLKINVFLAFKQEAMQMFPTAIKNTGAQAFTTITHTKCVFFHQELIHAIGNSLLHVT